MSAPTFPTTAVCDVGGAHVRLLDGIRPLAPGMHVCGPAFPVKLPPGDNLDFRNALDDIPEGSVVVLDADGRTDRAVAGDIVVERMMHRKLAGLVVYGCVRDAAEIASLGYPTFVVGTSPFGPAKKGGGAVDVSVTIGGVVVHPADVIVADADGVVVVEQAAWPDIADAVPAKLASDDRRLAAVRAGASLSDL